MSLHDIFSHSPLSSSDKARRAPSSKPTRPLKDILSTQNSPLVQEAALQTRAITRLEAYKRLAFSGLVIAALLIWTGWYGTAGRELGTVGIILACVMAPLAIILHVGIAHAKKNVQALLQALQSGDAPTPSPAGKQKN